MSTNDFLILPIIMLLVLFTSSATCFAKPQNSAQSMDNPVRSAKLIKETQVLKKPSFQSDVIGIAKEEEAINIQSRQRAWYFISVAESRVEASFTGWVNMLNVRFLGTAKRQGELGVDALITNTLGDGLSTVSTGVRGFDEDDLKNAKADLAQISLLDSYQVSADVAYDFAKQGKLKGKRSARRIGAGK